jgi:elongation factor G
MERFATEDIRNVALFGHGGSGKTSLSEAMLFNAGGIITRLGKVDEGNTVSDFDPDEQKKKMSVSTSLLPFTWKKRKVNLLDVPGFADFIGEAIEALRVVDGAVFVISAVSGLEVQAELLWSMADERDLPRLVFINKMDRENASFRRCLQELQEVFGTRIVPLQLPLGEEHDFHGVVDLTTGKALVYRDGKMSEEDPPEEMREDIEEAREKLIEGAAESSDDLMERYLNEEEISSEEVYQALLTGISSGTVVPVLCGSATHNIAVHPLMDAIVNGLPSPAIIPEIKGVKPGSGAEVALRPDEKGSLAALVFKTVSDPYVGRLTYFRVFSGCLRADSSVYNPNRDKEERVGQIFVVRGKQQIPVREIPAGDIGAVPKLAETVTGDTLCDKANPVQLPGIEFPEPVMSLAVEPKSKGDEDKLSTALSRISEEDPTFRARRDPEVKQTIISGMGEAHLEIAMERMARKFGVEVSSGLPKVPYKETIRKSSRAEGKHKKQTGGHGQFGIAWVEIEPLERGSGFEFVDKIVGGVIPKQFIPSVEKGIRKAMEEGYLAGYPIVDLRATVYDGKYHPVDSSDISFQIAGSLALRGAMEGADPFLLEPIMDVEVMVPEAYMGDVMGDLNAKRGKILGMERRGSLQVIRAQVPLAEMFRYSIDLRSITGGRGTFTMSFSHYEEVPAHLAQKIIEQSKAEKESS